MRSKLNFAIIEKTKKNKSNYSHETYSMILNNLKNENAESIHMKKKFYRFFTFSNVYIKNNKAHLYVSGEDNLIQEFLQHIGFNQIIRIDDMVLVLKNIEILPELMKKEKYLFKTNLIVNISENNKCVLCNDINYIEDRIKQITFNKAKQLNIDVKNKTINCKILQYKKVYDKYKNHHIESYKCKLKLEGDYELINLLYNVGIGENTATGHGLLWEVD